MLIFIINYHYNYSFAIDPRKNRKKGNISSLLPGHGAPGYCPQKTSTLTEKKLHQKFHYQVTGRTRFSPSGQPDTLP